MELAKAHPTIEPHVLDVTDRVAVEEFAARAGRLDAAVLNAAVNPLGPFDGHSLDTDAATVATNITSNLHLARVLKPALAGGRLVFVGSMAGGVPLPGQAVYSGTKAFVRNFALALRQEWAGEVSVGLFEPGGIKTEMTAELSHMERHLAPVEDVARDLARFVASGRAARVPGGANRAVSRLARLLPPATLARISRRLYRDG